MKKYLYSALALPLLFACSSENFDEKVISNDQFAGIEKVDAEFSMEGTTRFDGGVWNTEEGDLWGFAWMGDGTVIANNPADGKAYQNHNLIQTSGIFTPQTSIYVGKYYIYRPYDETTVSPQAINFNSLVDQPLAEGYASSTQAWKDLAKTAINIGDKWTDVDEVGYTETPGGTRWNKAGIKEHYKIYAALFSNQTGLDLTYVKNNPTFTAAKTVTGATDINLTYAAGTEVGAAGIYKTTVNLAGAAKSFTYAPTAEPNGAAHSGTYWADKKNLGAGFTFTNDVITLTAADAENGIETGDNGSKGWFWFNSLPVTAGDGALGTAVQTVLTTSYGVVTVNSTVGDCASVFEQYTPGTGSPEWIKIDAADNATTTPKKWALTHNTFVNQYGNHKGKYALTVDFSTGVMNGMHIKSDAHLQKLLKYYIASGKAESGVVLNLDKNSAGTFAISKISIALLQTINAGGAKVLLQRCTDPAERPARIVITQAGQTAENGQADKHEVPELKNVFAVAESVELSDAYEWTWNKATALQMDANVSSITLRSNGTLTVNSDNVEMSNDVPLAIAERATMNITKVTTVKNDLTNRGTINVGSATNYEPELRAYGADITNDASDLTTYGTINNYGVVGVTAGTNGHFYNYGYIAMKQNDAITLLTSNQTGGANFAAAWAAGNKMGTVELPNENATALVSVSNGTDQGFIKYKWTAKTYATPAGNVKYNTIIVSDDITFNAIENEIQYIEFDGTRTQYINPAGNTNLPNLKGIYVHAGKSIIIEKTNILDCSEGAYLGAKATIYKGGEFWKAGVDFTAGDATAPNNYFGAWSLDQIVEY